eukprot:6153072-Amphidinium_carterae.1
MPSKRPAWQRTAVLLLAELDSASPTAYLLAGPVVGPHHQAIYGVVPHLDSQANCQTQAAHVVGALPLRMCHQMVSRPIGRLALEAARGPLHPT